MRFPGILFGALLMSLWPTSTGQGSERWLDTRRWAEHRWERAGLMAQLPAGLTVRMERSGRVRVTHSVALRHEDPCNGGELQGYRRSRLLDFDAQIEVRHVPIDTVLRREYRPLYTEDSALLRKGWRQLRGAPREIITTQAQYQNCDTDIVLVQLNESRTAVVRRPLASALNSSPVSIYLSPERKVALYRRASRTPGVIPAEIADSIFVLFVRSLGPAASERSVP